MAKIKRHFVCSNCGTVLIKWEGRCPSCREWDTLVEEQVSKNSATHSIQNSQEPISLAEIKASNHPRIEVPEDPELSRVLGGGIVQGSMILLGGQPGIGKSTLMLQLACRLSHKVLYISGEESAYQIKMRADRITGGKQECLIYCETSLQEIMQQIDRIKPDLLFIDSIQTIASNEIDAPSGSMSQVRACANVLQSYAKRTHTTMIIIGHITKEGSLAGPKLLEHIVDVVLHFEGDHQFIYRILRTQKNRFGSTDEMGIYAMDAQGLRPVSNPSEMLISPMDQPLSGSTIAASVEGVRPLLIESQALVSPTVYGHPQRSATGFDNRRLSMLLAVLEKKGNLFFSQHDVFLNMAGGIKVTDPAIDLAIVAALVSSLHDIPVDRDICFAGEVGLSGEVRTVQRIEQRIMEAERLGFAQILISKYHKIDHLTPQIEIIQISDVRQMIDRLFT